MRFDTETFIMYVSKQKWKTSISHQFLSETPDVDSRRFVCFTNLHNQLSWLTNTLRIDGSFGSFHKRKQYQYQNKNKNLFSLFGLLRAINPSIRLKAIANMVWDFQFALRLELFGVTLNANGILQFPVGFRSKLSNSWRDLKSAKVWTNKASMSLCRKNISRLLHLPAVIFREYLPLNKKLSMKQERNLDGNRMFCDFE
jgi:hypothetical protein